MKVFKKNYLFAVVCLFSFLTANAFNVFNSSDQLLLVTGSGYKTLLQAVGGYTSGWDYTKHPSLTLCFFWTDKNGLLTYGPLINKCTVPAHAAVVVTGTCGTPQGSPPYLQCSNNGTTAPTVQTLVNGNPKPLSSCTLKSTTDGC